MNIRISRLISLFVAASLLGLTVSCSTTPKTGRKFALFNGKDLKGWSHVLADASVPMEKVWTVENGILVCQGTPVGAIYRPIEFTNFLLHVEYRWAPGETPGNSGIFSRISEPLKPLPKAVEVQLKHGGAGDVLGLQGRTVAPGQPRFFEVKAHPLAGDIAGVKAQSRNEKPAGEWNVVDIQATGDKYTVWMNGKFINYATGVEALAGYIGLQSEGGKIQFRRVVITPR